jgi:hypothetical protein
MLLTVFGTTWTPTALADIEEDDPARPQNFLCVDGRRECENRLVCSGKKQEEKEWFGLVNVFRVNMKFRFDLSDAFLRRARRIPSGTAIRIAAIWEFGERSDVNFLFLTEIPPTRLAIECS